MSKASWRKQHVLVLRAWKLVRLVRIYRYHAPVPIHWVGLTGSTSHDSLPFIHIVDFGVFFGLFEGIS